MSKQWKIPAAYLGELLEMSGSGKTNQELADWLLNTHNIKINLSTVQRFIRETKLEREAIASATIATEVQRTVVNDLEIINESIMLLRHEAAKSMKKGNKHEARALINEMGNYIDRHMQFLGIKTGNKTSFVEFDVEQISQKLLEKVKV